MTVKKFTLIYMGLIPALSCATGDLCKDFFKTALSTQEKDHTNPYPKSLYPQLYSYGNRHRYVYRGGKLDLKDLGDFFRLLKFSNVSDLPEDFRIERVRTILNENEGQKRLLRIQLEQGPWGNGPRLTMAAVNMLSTPTIYSGKLLKREPKTSIGLIAEISLNPDRDPLISWIEEIEDNRYNEAGLLLTPKEGQVRWFIADESPHVRVPNFYEVKNPIHFYNKVLTLDSEQISDSLWIEIMLKEDILQPAPFMSEVFQINRWRSDFITMVDMAYDGSFAKRFSKFKSDVTVVLSALGSNGGLKEARVQQSLEELYQNCQAEWNNAISNTHFLPNDLKLEVELFLKLLKNLLNK